MRDRARTHNPDMTTRYEFLLDLALRRPETLLGVEDLLSRRNVVGLARKKVDGTGNVREVQGPSEADEAALARRFCLNSRTMTWRCHWSADPSPRASSRKGPLAFLPSVKGLRGRQPALEQRVGQTRQILEHPLWQAHGPASLDGDAVRPLQIGILNLL